MTDEEFFLGHVWLNDEWVAPENLPEDLQAVISEIDAIFDQIENASTEEAYELSENPRLEELMTQMEEMLAELGN